MSFKPQLLEEIGIKVDSVPAGLTVDFTDCNQSSIKIQVPDSDPVFVDLRTRILGEEAVKKHLAETLIKFGAERAPAPLPPGLGAVGC